MLYKKIKVWWFKKTGTSCKERFFYTDNPGKTIEKNLRNQAKLNKNK